MKELVSGFNVEQRAGGFEFFSEYTGILSMNLILN
jgi:hypothetical protein